jgi:aminoacylase
VQGFVMNVQPSEAEAGFDVRLTPTADPDLLRRRIAEEWAPAWRNMTYKVNDHILTSLI